MDGLMMDYPLTITAMLRRTESMFGHKEIVSRRADRTLERSNYAQALGRADAAAHLARALTINPTFHPAQAADARRRLRAAEQVP